VFLKKRLDLIPERVAVVSGYVKDEQGVLTEITRIRASALQAEKAEGKSGRECISKTCLCTCGKLPGPQRQAPASLRCKRS